MFTHKCKNCKTEFQSRKRVKKYCSNLCYQRYRKDPDFIIAANEKRKSTCLTRYGCEHASQSDDVKERTKETCVEKYGCPSPTQNEDIHNKQKVTNLKRYGYENPMKNLDIQERQKNTCLSHHGVEFALQSNVIYDKYKNTCLKIYGTTAPSKLESQKEKTKESCLLKYGVDSPSKNKEIMDKIKLSKRLSMFNSLSDGKRLNPNITPLFNVDTYISTDRDNLYEFKCNECSHIFKDHLQNGRMPRCFNCNPRIETEVSQYENEIYEFICQIYDDTIITSDRLTIGPLELDILLPKLNLAIEFNGLYWHSEITGKKYKNYHLNKTNLCKKNNIRLIHIFEDEWLYKRDIVKSKLKSIILQDTSAVYARKCIIRDVTTSEKNDFLNTHHIQGADKSKIKLGLYYKSELKAIMTFGSLRVALGNTPKENQYELIRFASKDRVIGGASKLLKNFIQTHQPEKIISYADKRYSEGNLYNTIGFKKISESPPNYWYLNPSCSHREYRFKYRKNEQPKLLASFNDDLTEWQNMQLNGYDRIWDCGSIKFEMVIKKPLTALNDRTTK